MSMKEMEHILIVDDDSSIIDYLERGWGKFYSNHSLWGGDKVSFLQIFDPRETITKINEKQVRVVILDYDMPNQNGIEVLQDVMLLSNPPKVILLSNYPEYRAEALKLGAVHFFSKAEIHVNPILSKVIEVLSIQTDVCFSKLPADKIEPENFIETFSEVSSENSED